ncbi:MAG: oligosaccharide flippase family protein [Nitrososphaerota archaeon]|nr:oligosaccharide flippase family protein [Nitrososphaerota archaeon]
MVRMDIEKVGKSTAGNIAISGLTKASRFLAFVLIARYLDPENFATYALVIASVEIFRAFAEFGIDTIVVRSLSEPRDRPHNYVKAALQLKVALNILIACIGVLSFHLIFPHETPAVYGIILLSIGSLFYSMSNTLRAGFLAKLEMHRVLVPTLFVGVAYITLLVVVTKMSMSIYCVFGLQSAVEAVTFAWLLKLTHLHTSRQYVDRHVRLFILKNAFPLALVGGFVVVYSRESLFFLSKLGGPTAVSTYSVTYRITESVMIVAAALAANLFPLFSAAKGTDERLRTLVASSIRILFYSGLVIALAFSIRPEFVLRILYSDRYLSGGTTLSLLAMWIPLASTNMVLTNAIIAKDGQRIIAIIGLVNLGVNIIANIILVRAFEDRGAAAAALLTEAFNSVMQLMTLKKLLRIQPVTVIPLYQLVSFGLATAGILFLSRADDSLLAIGLILATGMWFMIRDDLSKHTILSVLRR